MSGAQMLIYKFLSPFCYCIEEASFFSSSFFFVISFILLHISENKQFVVTFYSYHWIRMLSHGKNYKNWWSILKLFKQKEIHRYSSESCFVIMYTQDVFPVGQDKFTSLSGQWTHLSIGFPVLRGIWAFIFLLCAIISTSHLLSNL